jgi:hypothetical protein
MKKYVRLLAHLCLAACLVSLLPARASAWSAPGHRMVVQIARWRLQQLKAANALKRIDAILNAKLDRPMAERPRTWEKAAVWPDDVRGSDEYCYADNMHFVSIPLGPDAGPDEYDPATQCRPNVVGVHDKEARCTPTVKVDEGVCSVGGVEHFRSVLTTTGSSKARLEALSFVFHLVGDMHQPLHNSEDRAFHNYKGETGDRGGNYKFVCYFNEAVCTSPKQDSCYKYDLDPKTKHTACVDVFKEGAKVSRSNKQLHATWDKYMIQSEMALNPGRGDEVAYVKALTDSLPKNPNSAFYAEAVAGSPADWAAESHELAQAHAYPQGPFRKKSAADKKVYDFYYISPAYQAENIKVVDRQLIRAGLRLAAYLNRIYP